MSNPYRDKLLSVGYIKGNGRNSIRCADGQIRPKVAESTDENGDRTKAITDEAGNTVTEHNNAKDQVDVMIRPASIEADLTIK